MRSLGIEQSNHSNKMVLENHWDSDLLLCFSQCSVGCLRCHPNEQQFPTPPVDFYKNDLLSTAPCRPVPLLVHNTNKVPNTPFLSESGSFSTLVLHMSESHQRLPLRVSLSLMIIVWWLILRMGSGREKILLCAVHNMHMHANHTHRTTISFETHCYQMSLL